MAGSFPPLVLILILAFLASIGCGGNEMQQPKPTPERAIITVMRMKGVEPGTEITVRDPATVNELRAFFVPDPERGHQRTPSITSGSIAFVDEDGDKEEFHFGLFEWLAFGSDREYPFPAAFHVLVKEIIENEKAEGQVATDKE